MIHSQTIGDDMPESDQDELLRRLSELEAENRDLRVRTALLAESGASTSARAPHKRPWGWTVLATVLIVLGAILAPVAIVATWAQVTLTDTERFVATYAPLAEEAAVQAYVTDEVVTIINDRVDIPAITSDVIDGITSLGTGPAATKALDALKGPAAAGLQSLIQNRVAKFVSSETFATVWEQALRITHKQFVATMQGNPQAAVAIGSDGSIGVQLAPIIEAVKSALVEQGITIAEQIPTINRTITVAQSDSIPTVQLGYSLAVAAGAWLSWVALGLLAAGVLVARRKSRALIWAAVALAITSGLAVAAFAIGQGVFITSVSPSLLPSDVAGILYATVIGAMQDTAVAVLTLALVVAIVGWLAGPFDTPRKLRGFVSAGTASLRNAAARRGLTTGRFGEALYAQRVLIHAAIAVIAAAVIVFVRPISISLILWTLVIALIVLALVELLQRPPAPESDSGPEPSDSDLASPPPGAPQPAETSQPSEASPPTEASTADADGTPTEVLDAKR